MQELDTTQCSIWVNTSSMCAKPQTTSQTVSTLCYQCTIIDESSQISLPDLDRKARGLLTGLADQINEGKERSKFGEKVTREAVEQLRSYVDMYSAKVQVAEQKAREERRKRVMEREKRQSERAKRDSGKSDKYNESDTMAGNGKVDREEQNKTPLADDAVPEKKLPFDHQPERGRLRELESKVNSITKFWRDQVRVHEEQMEAAGRSHSPWRLSAIMSKLDATHKVWNQRIKETFEDAYSALK